MKYFITLFLLLNLLMVPEAGSYNTQRNTMAASAQDYIDGFKRGEDFSPPSKGLVASGQPDLKSLEILGKELAVGNPNVRENIVKLLVDIGRTTDPLTSKGADALRHDKIIALLAAPGLAKADLGREAAMEALRKFVTTKGLSRFGDLFADALEKSPTDEALLLVAKAKASKARATVTKLLSTPRWQNSESTKIAGAALGSVLDEDVFLAAAAAASAASNGDALAKAIVPLGLIGTPRSLKAIAELLRSPLTIEVSGHMPGKSIKSVRLNVLEALLYNYPEEPALYPNNINEDEDYRTAERFCAAALGVVYRSPPPPYLKYGNIPPQPIRR